MCIRKGDGVGTEPFLSPTEFTSRAVEYRDEGVDLNADPIDPDVALALVKELLQQVSRQLEEVDKK